MAMSDYAQNAVGYSALDKAPGVYSQATLAARPETEIDIVRSALGQSRELADYVCNIVNRVCGHAPEAAGEGLPGKDYDPDGVLPQLGADANRSMRDINGAMSALRRLADRLP